MKKSLALLPGPVIGQLLNLLEQEVLTTVRNTYMMHGAGATNNPPSHFLRFDDRPEARIIALPAAVRGEQPVAGIKWISSYPRNIQQNLQRASAVLLLNDYETGYPIACMEAAQISAARTAASAVIGAEALVGQRNASKIAIIGAGVIARTIANYFAAARWTVGSFAIHDLNLTDAKRLAEHAQKQLDTVANVEACIDDAISDATCIVFATTAATPHVHGVGRLKPGQVVLHISLRDLSPEIILESSNIVDDIEHCLKADTSPHLAEKQCGHRRFVDGSIAEVLSGQISIRQDRPTVFSPFGLGVLDVALGHLLLRHAEHRGLTRYVDDFFGTTARW